MNRSRFLITGLPRCRTAWLTVLFKTLSVDVRHERYSFDSMDELEEWLKGGTEQNPRGLIDGFAACAYPTKALELFKAKPIVFIHRDFNDAVVSWQKWSGYAAPPESIPKLKANFQRFFMTDDSAWMPWMRVGYKHLDNYATVNEIVKYCVNKELPKDLFDWLTNVKIELHAAKAFEQTKRNPKPWLQTIE